MKKAIAILLCVCVCAFFTAGFALAQSGDFEVAIFIDGESFVPSAPIIVENGVTYVPLRSFCEAMSETVSLSWDDTDETVKVVCQELEIKTGLDWKYLVANGRYLYIPDGVLMYNGTIMLPVRQLARVFGADIEWDDEQRAVFITSGDSVIEHAEDFYDLDALYWLSRIIFAESGIEDIEGQIAVGNVVLNRVEDDDYPDTIYEVVFDTLHGVQFTPVSNGTINNEPSEESVIAAMLVLDGANTAGDSIFFLNEEIAEDLWIVDNCDYVTTIGSHSFYM